MIDLVGIRARAAQRMRALQAATPANAANRLTDGAAAVSHLAALAGGAAGSSGPPGVSAPGTDARARDAANESDEALPRFNARRERLQGWGWSESEAEALAARLGRRDRDEDDRASCVECRHHRPGRCGNHRRAGLSRSEVGRDLAELLQRCEGFAP